MRGSPCTLNALQHCTKSSSTNRRNGALTQAAHARQGCAPNTQLLAWGVSGGCVRHGQLRGHLPKAAAAVCTCAHPSCAPCMCSYLVALGGLAGGPSSHNAVPLQAPLVGGCSLLLLHGWSALPLHCRHCALTVVLLDAPDLAGTVAPLLLLLPALLHLGLQAVLRMGRHACERMEACGCPPPARCLVLLLVLRLLLLLVLLVLLLLLLLLLVLVLACMLACLRALDSAMRPPGPLAASWPCCCPCYCWPSCRHASASRPSAHAGPSPLASTHPDEAELGLELLGGLQVVVDEPEAG